MMSRDQDWRLRLDLDRSTDLDGLVAHVRDRPDDLEGEARSVLSDDVVLTHDDDTFFAYAVNERAIDSARDAIESVLRSEQRKGAIRVSHWDENLRAWRQIDPPLTPAEEEQLRQVSAVDHARLSTAADAESETRTVMCVMGKQAHQPRPSKATGWVGPLIKTQQKPNGQPKQMQHCEHERERQEKACLMVVLPIAVM